MSKLKKQQPTTNTRRRRRASQRPGSGSYPPPPRSSRQNTRIRTTPRSNRIPSPRVSSYSPYSEPACTEVGGPPPLEIAPSVRDAHRGAHNRPSSSRPPSHSCNELPSRTASSQLLADEGTEGSPRRVTNVDLYRILRNQDLVYSENFIDEVRRQTNGMLRDTIDFSQRFQMVMVPWKGNSVWFACVDGTPFVFALSEHIFTGELSIKNKSKCKVIPCIAIAPGGCTWTALQQKLVDRFDADDHVRAVLAACMLSFKFSGKFTCVLEALCPTSLRRFIPAIEFNVPIDQDILTCLADPFLTEDGKLFFDCDGACAVVQHPHDGGVYHLESISPPVTKKRFKETSQRLMPFLYGIKFGEVINRSSDDYTRTNEISNLMKRLEAKGYHEGNVYNILKAVQLEPPQKELDLIEAANMLTEVEGVILPGGFSEGKSGSKPRKKKKSIGSFLRRAMRRITGDVILVGKDGLYRSNRFKGMEVEGYIEANLGLVKAGCKASHEIQRNVDKRITSVSEVAAYIFGEKYVRLDTDGDKAMGPDMDNLWNDEVAVANTLAALICRRYGMFKGFSSSASSPKFFDSPPNYLRSLLPDKLEPRMVADVYLPAVHVFVDPPRQLQMMRDGLMLLLSLFVGCTLAASLLYNPELAMKRLVTYAVVLFFAAQNLEGLEEWFYRGCLKRIGPWWRPHKSCAKRGNRQYNLLIHNNPFVDSGQNGEVLVLGHHGSYNFENCYPAIIRGREVLFLFCSFLIILIFFL